MSTNTQINNTVLTNEERIGRFNSAFSVLASYERGIATPSRQVAKIRFVSISPLNFVDKAGGETFDLMRYTYLEECVWERFNACRFSSEERKSVSNEVISSRIARIDAILRSRLVEEETRERVVKTVVPIRTLRVELTSEELKARLIHANRVLMSYEIGLNTPSRQVVKVRFVSVEPLNFVDKPGDETFDPYKYRGLKACVWERFNAYKFSSEEKKSAAKEVISSRIARIDAILRSRFLDYEARERVVKEKFDAKKAEEEILE